MFEKKELFFEELEKVNGGDTLCQSFKDIKWLFTTKNTQVYVELNDGTKVVGLVTKRGFIGFTQLSETYHYDFYYIESTENTNVNGWYGSGSFSNKTVSINNKLKGLAEPTVASW